MSGSFPSLNLTSILPPDSQWIAPWVTQVLQSVEGEIALGHSPYPAFEETVLRIFYPSVTPGFRAMLWFLAGLFSLSIVVVLASLVLRLQQGRFWLFHRVDKTIVIPNISTIYGICALVYAALGILSIVTAVRVSKGERFPRYYLGLQAGWIAPLWVGFFCEAWATISAWYIRKKGAFYRESRWKTIVALTLPFLLPICAFVPVVVIMSIAARAFNDGYRDAMSIVAQLKIYDQSWTPAKGLDIGNLLNFFTLGEKFGAEMRGYSKYVRIGYLYIAFTLLVTFAVYTTGASLEIRHLSATIKKLRAQSKMPRLRSRSPLTKFRRGTTSKSVQLAETKPEKPFVDPLDDEFFAGVKRQWTLLGWARNNRFYSACAIGLMLLVNAAIAFWLGVSPLSLMTNSAQFQVQLLVACWLNGILSTVGALLILFRSLDGSSPTVQRLRRYLPFLPFPPAISITDPSRATSLNTKQSRADGGAASHIDSRMEEPPKYPGSSWSNAHAPVMEERKGGTAFLEVPQQHGAVDLGLPETEYLNDEYDLDAALDNACYGFGVSHIAGRDPREVDNLHVVLEMLERPASSMGEGTSSAVHTEMGGGEGTSIRARTDSCDGGLRSQRSHERFDS